MVQAGGEPKDLCREAPSAAVAKLVGMQYYWIRHHEKLALLGYIAALESYPPSTSMLDRLNAVHSLPEAALRTLRVHAAVDPSHIDRLAETVDALILSDAQMKLITRNAIDTAIKTRLVFVADEA
jgi:hypothetical protein